MQQLFNTKQKEIISQEFVEYPKTRVVIGALFIAAALIGMLVAEFFYLGFTKEIKSIKSGAVHITPELFEPANEGKIVYMSGFANTSETLRDPQFGVQENALILKRFVYIYQWTERQKHSNRFSIMLNIKSYKRTYDLSWHEGLNSHKNFIHPEGHENPESVPYNSQVYHAKQIKMGNFYISPDFEMSQYVFFMDDYHLSQSNWDLMDESLKQFFELNSNSYVRGSLSNPAIGDIMVSFKVLRPATMTIIGRQEGNTIVPLGSEYVNTSSLYRGNLSLDQIFAIELRYAINILVIRCLCLLFIGIGLKIGFARNIVVKNTPILNEMPHFGVLFTMLFRLGPIYMLTISIPFIFFKPTASIVTMCVFGFIFYIAPKVFLYFEGAPDQPKRLEPKEIGPKQRASLTDRINTIDKDNEVK